MLINGSYIKTIFSVPFAVLVKITLRFREW